MPVAGHVGAFVGRARELAHLTASLDQTMVGSGRTVLIAGEPGIGKTRLADEFAFLATRRRASVLWGRCYEGEGAPAFWPWTQILRSYLEGRDAADLQTVLGADAAELSHVVPAPRGDRSVPVEPSALTAEQARFRLFEAVHRLLSAAAGVQPLVLILDDLHWADAPSLLLLQFLAREIASLPLLLIGIYRSGEPDHHQPLAQALAAFARTEGRSDLRLTGLSEPDMSDYLATLLGTTPSPEVVAGIAERGEGNPFFAGELADLLAEEARAAPPSADWARSPTLPPGVCAVLDARLAGLSPACLLILSGATILGRDFSLDLLMHMGGVDPATVLDALEEAEAARIVASATGQTARYRFAHALIREHLYARLPTARRLRLHRQVCDALEQVYGTDRGEHLTELAHHCLEAAPIGDAGKAVHYARRAGEQAMVRLAYEEAARQFGRALTALAMAPADVHERVRCCSRWVRRRTRRGIRARPRGRLRTRPPTRGPWARSTCSPARRLASAVSGSPRPASTRVASACWRKRWPPWATEKGSMRCAYVC